MSHFLRYLNLFITFLSIQSFVQISIDEDNLFFPPKFDQVYPAKRGYICLRVHHDSLSAT